MRMRMRRFTRLTNAFSKKVENHAASVALYTLHSNFAAGLQEPCESLPADPGDGGIADHVWRCEEIAALPDQAAIVESVVDGIVVGPTVWQLIVGLFAIGGWYLTIRAAWDHHRMTMIMLAGFALVTSAASLIVLLSG